MGVPLAGRAILPRRSRCAHRALLTQVSSLRVTVPNAECIKIFIVKGMLNWGLLIGFYQLEIEFFSDIFHFFL